MGVKLTKGRSVQVDIPFGGRSVRVKMFGGRSVGGRSVKAPVVFTISTFIPPTTPELFSFK
jgi:hypothetical protein